MTHILSNRAMLVAVNIRQWTGRKFDLKLTREVTELKNAAEDSGRWNKQLVPKSALESIRKIATEARTFHYDNTLPWDNDGWRILPAANYSHWSDEMRRSKQAFEAAFADFKSDWEHHVEEGKKRLNGMYDRRDYPDKRELDQLFEFGTKAQPIPDGSHFVLDLGDEELAAIASQTDQRVEHATEAAMRDLWNRVHEAVKHMAERLTATRKDKHGHIVPATFHDTLVGNLREIVDLLPRLNVTNDPTLEDMRKAIEAKLTAAEPQQLREEPKTRREVAKAAEDISKQMAAFMS